MLSKSVDKCGKYSHNIGVLKRRHFKSMQSMLSINESDRDFYQF